MIMSAVGNHDEGSCDAVSPVSGLALIIAGELRCPSVKGAQCKRN